MLQLAQNIEHLCSQREPFVCVTLTQIKGSAPQVEGAKILVTNAGLHWGTVGGGKIEAHAIAYARNLLSSGEKSHAREWNLQTDIGMSCGGAVTLFFDVYFTSNLNLAVFGAGHVSQELCRVLSNWSGHISVFDDRADWLERLPASSNLQRKLSTDLGAEVASLPAGTFLLSLTKGHSADVPVLFEALKRAENFPFIGVIGSDVKAVRIKSELIKLGSTKENVEKLICPVGLPIGDNTPTEIAISIAAQLLAARDQNSFSIQKGIA
jgi:xanthine dehydrogenase accessory factor